VHDINFFLPCLPVSVNCSLFGIQAGEERRHGNEEAETIDLRKPVGVRGLTQ